MRIDTVALIFIEMSKKSRIYGLLGFSSVVIGFICKVFYRNYINSNGINDYGIGGFLPSYFYVLGLSLLLLIRPTRFPKLVIWIVTVASILYEIKQYITGGIFDVKDALASIMGGITAVLAVKIIESDKPGI